MSRALILEEFAGDAAQGDDAAPVADPPAAPEPDAPKEDPVEAYERGYRAGWDDSEAKTQAARDAVGAELARNIQELGFTYHEARAHVMSGIEPLLEALLGKVLPQLVAETLGPAILEELRAVAETAADRPVTILVSPASHDTVAGFLAEATALPFELVSEPTLGEWQVCFRLGDHERQLDLGEVLDRIMARFRAFSDQNQRVLNHG
ncbi:flagellar biosynthesis protein [Frigidibacter sp. ROC022]|uniref:flagellar biosynthesis protein n=1 Tax=Frigidibacter sp. ROC022 TaxID=2971796 RepID=UPI00215B374F|nr:flagellar biosynthesis protein [Frigidibacter sp. ROC022]MCR8724352.1 flagellar biosynthesis protein [Frigidibacter sp. ROC022]